jgi:ribonuclease PH
MACTHAFMFMHVCIMCAPAGSRRQRGKMDRRSTELSKVIRNTLEQTVCLELLPRSQIDVYVQVRLGRC